MKSEVNAVATVLADPENAELTAEEVAEKVIFALDAKRAATHNLIVVGRFGFPDSPQFEAALGPLSTRAKTAAHQLGDGFAWDYKTKIGSGRFKLLPLLRHPKAAWDYARNVRELDPSKQVEVTSLVEDALYGPVCSCGSPLERHPTRTSAGDLITGNTCPRHPEGHP